MAEPNPTEQNSSPPDPKSGPAISCEAWQSLLPEALEDGLSAEELALFERHGQECASCARMLKEAQQGAAWLSLLEAQPEASPDLVGRILSKTSGNASGAKSQIRRAVSPAWATMAATSPAVPQIRLVPRTQRVLGLRHLLSTAAMAFFSLVLTLNLVSARFSGIRLADLRPEALRANLARQYYSADARVVRYYENLRFVNEVEAMVREFTQPDQSGPGATQPGPASRNGGEEGEDPRRPSLRVTGSVAGGWESGSPGEERSMA